MKNLCLVLLLWSMVAGLAYAEGPQTLKEGSWLCSTPEAYDQAIEEERKWQGKDLEELKKQLLEKKLCMSIESEYLEDMMPPYVRVLERQGEKAKVSFTVEFEKRIQLLHRKISRITYAGWTSAENLKDYCTGTIPC